MHNNWFLLYIVFVPCTTWLQFINIINVEQTVTDKITPLLQIEPRNSKHSRNALLNRNNFKRSDAVKSGDRRLICVLTWRSDVNTQRHHNYRNKKVLLYITACWSQKGEYQIGNLYTRFCFAATPLFGRGVLPCTRAEAEICRKSESE